MSKKLNCLIAQSGGPSSVINSSLAGIIEASLNNSTIDRVYGAINGITGVLNDTILELNECFSNPANIEILKSTPAMYLGSCRYKLAKVDDWEYKKIFELFKKMNIGLFFYIGGNDSMDTVLQLNNYAKKHGIQGINIIGVPKTIDNDLFGTDHAPGYGSAAKYIATTLLEIMHDTYIYNTNSVTIVEIMGRNAGWLTAAAALARTGNRTAPDLIYLPERTFTEKQFIDDLREVFKKKKNIIVAVSEGIRNEEGKYVAASSDTFDKFGHAKLSGAGSVLEYMVTKNLDCKTRAIQLNVLQRSASHIGSLTDVNEAHAVGRKAVELATNGVSGEMVVINRVCNSPYTASISSLPIENIANLEKKIPLEWINEAGNDVTQELVEYIKPLIQGEVKIRYDNGIPKYLPIDHLFYPGEGIN